MPLVGIVIGSKSDQGIADETAKVLDSLGISYESSVISAHRKPEETRNYGKSAESRDGPLLVSLWPVSRGALLRNGNGRPVINRCDLM